MKLRAGFLSDPFWNYFNLGKADEKRPHRNLLHHLSHFELCSNVRPLESDALNYKHPLLAILHNQIVRGYPTRASIMVEEHLSTLLDLTEYQSKHGSIEYNAHESWDVKELATLLCFADPYFKESDYNYDGLDENSQGEKRFIQDLFHRDNILGQLFTPQRYMNEVVSPQRLRDFERQEVDFCYEAPYLYGNETTIGQRKGLVIEIDGSQHALNNVQRILDNSRDQALADVDFKSYRFSHDKLNDASKKIYSDLQEDYYVNKVKDFSEKIKNGDRSTRKIVQQLYIPFAVARIQIALLRFLSENLNRISDENPIKLCFVERDFVAGEIAAKDLACKLQKLQQLMGKKNLFGGFSTASYGVCDYSEWEMFQRGETQDYKDWDENEKYDLIIDHSILRRDGIEKYDYPSTQTDSIIKLRSTALPFGKKFNNLYKPDRRIQSDKSSYYNPLTFINAEGKTIDIETQREILQIFLQDIFRKESFRPGQLPILNRALQNKNVIGLLPTGGGKSLTYQVASMLQPGAVLVIDPIKSLMQDQYEGLQKLGIDASNFINSSLKTNERILAQQELLQGEVMFCFVSPERLVIESFRKDILAEMKKQNRFFSYCVIDEVHCVSEWGHDFRTPYLSLGKNCIDFCATASGKPVPLFGLTATASFDVLADVERELFVKADEEIDALVRHENTNRPELHYKVLTCTVEYPKDERFWQEGDGILPPPLTDRGYWADKGIRDRVGEARQERLMKCLQIDLKKDLTYLNERIEPILEHDRVEYMETASEEEQVQFIENYEKRLPLENIEITSAIREPKMGGGLLFCPHRQGRFGVTDTYAKRWDRETQQWIPKTPREGVLDALPIHIKGGYFMGSGDHSDGEIETDSMKNQRQFIESQIAVMVATKAFGMGIDKANIRTTAHMSHPSSLEAFVQESGRGGRDGKLALSYVFYDVQKLLKVHSKGISELKDLFLKGNWKPKSNQWETWFNKLTGEIYFEEENFRQSRNGNIQDMWKDIEAVIQDDRLPKAFSIERTDRKILDFFHDNSFKGALKEKANCEEILVEMKVTILETLKTFVQDELEAEGFESMDIRPWQGGQNQRLYISIDHIDQGYIDLNTYRMQGGIAATKAGAKLVETLRAYEAADLYKHLTTSAETIPGILDQMSTLLEDQSISIDISFRNSVDDVLSKVHKAFDRYGVPFTLKKIEQAHKGAPTFWDFIENLEKELNRNQIERTKFLVDILAQIDERNGKHKGESLEKLEYFYSGIRTEADTFKAIYRLISTGLVSNYTVDYNAKVITVDATKRTTEAYIEHTRGYFLRYLSDRLAERLITDIRKAISKDENTNPLLHCVNGIIDFAYEQVADKRKLAIDDIDRVISESAEIDDLVKSSHTFKDNVYLYFNSKYARQGFVTPEGTEASLLDDILSEVLDSKELFEKYITLPLKDSSGPTLTNLKHLRGASTRAIRSYSRYGELYLIRAFTLLALSSRNPNMFEDAYNDFNSGLKRLREAEVIKDGEQLMDWSETLRKTLELYSENIENKEQVNGFINSIFLQWYAGWSSEFIEKYASQEITSL